jgi:hypothetical protein
MRPLHIARPVGSGKTLRDQEGRNSSKQCQKVDIDHRFLQLHETEVHILQQIHQADEIDAALQRERLGQHNTTNTIKNTTIKNQKPTTNQKQGTESTVLIAK